MMAALKAWLRQEGFWLYAGHAGSDIVSHVFLDGGKASVPLERMQDFFKEYASCVNNGDIPCAVERLSAVGEDGAFRMFMDVDLKDFQGDRGDLKTVADQILSALPGELDVGDVVVCCKDKRAINKKEGLHLIWNDVYVSTQDALRLLAVTVSNLVALFPNSLTDWMPSLDGSVYKNSGLRMAYSAKGRDDAGVYVPWFVSSVSSLEEERSIKMSTNEDTASWLAQCSIIPPTPVKLESKMKGKKIVKITNVPDSAFEAVVSGTPYSGSKFSITRSDNAVLMRLDSKFCYNIGKEHKSNHAYLIVTRQAVNQACYCKCAHTGCSTSRQVLAGSRNPLSLFFFPSRTASVLPSNETSAMMRWSSAIAKQRS